MPTRTVVGFGFLGSLRPRWPQLHPAPGLQGGRPGQASPPPSELSAADWPLTSPSSVFLCAFVCLSVCLAGPAGAASPSLPAPLRGPQQGGSPHLRAGLAAPAWGAARGPHLCYLPLLFPTGNGSGGGPPPAPQPLILHVTPGQPASCARSLPCAHACVCCGSQQVPTCTGGYLQSHSSTVPLQGGSQGLWGETPE